MLDPTHEPILTAALRAPSAHNAQPWRLVEDEAMQCYELHYDHTDYLPYDPDDRDAYLCLGAFVETLSLAAIRHGQRARFDGVFSRAGSDFFVGRISLRPAHSGDAGDVLAEPAVDRHTNRSEYDTTPLPAALVEELHVLGCVMVVPDAMSRLVAKASVCAWRDPRFVDDLHTWMKLDDNAAPVGMTPAGLPLTRVETAGLRLAFKAKRLPALLARVFASRDVRLLRHATTVAVLQADGLAPQELFDAGRRLLRAWVAIGAVGFACHPISIAVDRTETVGDVAAISSTPCPVAVFRVGHPTGEAPRSNRRPLTDVLRTAKPAPA
jgi:nitroreductase